MIGRLRRPAEPPAQRAARPERARQPARGGGQARPRRLAALALLVLAAAPPAAGAAVPGSAQPAPGLARALGELGVGAEAFAALPAAARGLFGLLVGRMDLLQAHNAELESRLGEIERAQEWTMADEMEMGSQPEAGLEAAVGAYIGGLRLERVMVPLAVD